MKAFHSNSFRSFHNRRSSSAGSYGPSLLQRTRRCGVATVAIGSICSEPSRRTVSSTDVAEPSSTCARTAILRASSAATTRGFTALTMALDELQNAVPGALGGFGELLVAAVEEAVRRALVGDELVLDAGRLERLLERLVVVGGDVLVVACLQGQDRRLDVSSALDRSGLAVALGRHPVEADRAGEVVAVRGRQPRVAPPEAEADGEDGAAAELAEPFDGRGNIRADPLRRRLRDVLRVLELVAALLDARRSAEVVDRERRAPALGEAQR